MQRLDRSPAKRIDPDQAAQPAGIDVLNAVQNEDVDGRNKSGHDELSV
jgi:hypothetical protein